MIILCLQMSGPDDPMTDPSLETRVHPDVQKVSKEVQCSTLIEQSAELQRKYQQGMCITEATKVTCKATGEKT